MRTRLVFIALVGALFLPLAASAAGIPFFGPIFPSDANQCAASWGLLTTVINNIIRVLLSFAIVLIAPLMLAYAGFLFAVNPVDPSGIAKARNILTNTVIGIVVALAAWLIVNAIMVNVYNPGAQSGETRLGAWYSLLTTSGNSCINLPTSFSPAPAPTVPPVVPVPGAADEASVRARLAAAGVTINNNPCPTGSNGSGCTNVANMKEATIQQIINIADACGGRPNVNACGLVVTGGTEPGHAPGTYSHGNGYKVDIRPNADLNAYLQSFRSLGTRTGDHPGPAWTDSCGQNQYVREDATAAQPAHWDITVMATCGLDKSLTVTAPRCTSAPTVPVALRPGPGLSPAAGVQPGVGVFTFVPLPSGTIGSFTLPDTYNSSPSYTGGRLDIGEASGSPFGGTVIEMSISHCQGNIDSSLGACYYRSQLTNFNELAWNARSGVDSKFLNDRGICDASGPGPWYVNLRWTYSACNIGEGRCGFAVGWYGGGGY